MSLHTDRWLVIQQMYGPTKGHWIAFPPGWTSHALYREFPTWREAFDFAAAGRWE